MTEIPLPSTGGEYVVIDGRLVPAAAAAPADIAEPADPAEAVSPQSSARKRRLTLIREE